MTDKPNPLSMDEQNKAELVEAMLRARHKDLPEQWPDGYSEGLARIERMKAEWMLEPVLDRIESLTRDLAEARGALEPFATFAADNTDTDGWAGNRCEGERIVDWFGPSDFRRAAKALSLIQKDSTL